MASFHIAVKCGIVLFSETTVRESAHLAVEAEAALSQSIDIFFFQMFSRHEPRQDEIEDRPL